MHGRHTNSYINTLRPQQNGWHSADDIFKCMFLNCFARGHEATRHYFKHCWHKELIIVYEPWFYCHEDCKIFLGMGSAHKELNPPGAETKIAWDNLVNILVADALAPFIARLTMVLSMQEKTIQFQLPLPPVCYYGLYKHTNDRKCMYIIMSLGLNSVRQELNITPISP